LVTPPFFHNGDSGAPVPVSAPLANPGGPPKPNGFAPKANCPFLHNSSGDAENLLRLPWRRPQPSRANIVCFYFFAGAIIVGTIMDFSATGGKQGRETTVMTVKKTVSSLANMHRFLAFRAPSTVATPEDPHDPQPSVSYPAESWGLFSNCNTPSSRVGGPPGSAAPSLFQGGPVAGGCATDSRRRCLVQFPLIILDSAHRSHLHDPSNLEFPSIPKCSQNAPAGKVFPGNAGSSTPARANTLRCSPAKRRPPCPLGKYRIETRQREGLGPSEKKPAPVEPEPSRERLW